MLKEYKLYGEESIIRFDDERHRFYGQEGESLISVTGITGVVDKSGPLMYWAINLMRDYLIPRVNGGITEEDVLEADGITDTQLEYNTGQHLTTTSSPTFYSYNSR